MPPAREMSENGFVFGSPSLQTKWRSCCCSHVRSSAVILWVLLVVAVSCERNSNSFDFSKGYADLYATLYGPIGAVTSLDGTRVREINWHVGPAVNAVCDTAFFGIIAMDMSRECPYWDTGSVLCTSPGCTVDMCPSEEVPSCVSEDSYEYFLSSLSGDSHYSVRRPPNEDECDMWVFPPDVCSPDLQQTYVDLRRNPERFTGYSGYAARKVWESVYSENCLTVEEKTQLDRQTMLQQPLPSSETCTGIKVMYRVLSGMQASISTHLSFLYPASLMPCPNGTSEAPPTMLGGGALFQEPLEQAPPAIDFKNEKFVPNVYEFDRRVFSKPLRLRNLYMLYVMLLEAVGHAEPAYRQLQFDSGTEAQEIAQLYDNLFERVRMMRAVHGLEQIPTGECAGSAVVVDDVGTGALVDAAERQPRASASQEKKKKAEENPAEGEFHVERQWTHWLVDRASILALHDTETREGIRMRLFKISRLMDCVSCEKCRLWGKVQVTGIGAAFKILLADDPRTVKLSRTELVSLLNALNRYSHSIVYADEMIRIGLGTRELHVGGMRLNLKDENAELLLSRDVHPFLKQ